MTGHVTNKATGAVKPTRCSILGGLIHYTTFHIVLHKNQIDEALPYKATHKHAAITENDSLKAAVKHTDVPIGISNKATHIHKIPAINIAAIVAIVHGQKRTVIDIIH